MQYNKGSKKIGDFLMGKTIGQGTFGKVKSGIHMPSGNKVAIKILQKNKIQLRDDLTRVHNQLSILYNKVDHPNIIKLLQLHQSVSNIYIITEFIQGKQLYEMIVQNGNLDYKKCGIYFCQLVDAVSYLHQIGICHRDIKPQNIIVDGDNLKLIDFGLSKQFGNNSMLQTSCGSPCYAAPQMLRGTKYDCIKSDIWAMGVTLYAMAAGHLPFEDQNTQRLYSLINIGHFQPIKENNISTPNLNSKQYLNNKYNQFNTLINYNRSISNNSQSRISTIPKHKQQINNLQQSFILSSQTSLILLNDLLAKMLQTQPKLRIKIKDIYQNAWIKQCVSYLNKKQTEYQNDQILLYSMSKYFKKSVKQIKQILKNKQIMSICTYYYLNRKKKIYPEKYNIFQVNNNNHNNHNNHNNQQLKYKSISRSKQKNRIFNSHNKLMTSIEQNNNSHNPESGHKKLNQNQSKILNYLSPEKYRQNIHTTTDNKNQIKNKSITSCQIPHKQTSILSKQILKQINNKNSHPHHQYSHIQHNSQNLSNINNKIIQLKMEQQNPQVHVGAFHLNYTFSTLQDVYQFIQNQLNKSKNNVEKQQLQAKLNANIYSYQIHNNQIQEQSEQQQQEEQYEQHKYQNNIQCQQQAQIEQQYMLYNNKYVLSKNSNKKQHNQLFKVKQTDNFDFINKISNYNKNIKQNNKNTKMDKNNNDKQINKQKNIEKVRFLSKYCIQYKGIIIYIKLIQNLNMYYLDLPAYFVELQ